MRKLKSKQAAFFTGRCWTFRTGRAAIVYCGSASGWFLSMRYSPYGILADDRCTWTCSRSGGIEASL